MRSELPESPKLKVLMVAPSLDILGGQAVQARRLFDLLSPEPDLDLRFLPVNPRLPGPLALLQRIKYLRTVATSLAYAAGLFRAVPDCDVLHIFSASYWSFLLAPSPAIFVARLFGKPTILNYRSGEAEDHLKRWKSAVATLRRVDAIVTPSGYLVDVFSRFGLAARSIFNTVSAERFPFHGRNPLRPVFLSNRNFHPMYNVSNTIRAFAEIRARYLHARLVIVGDGEERDLLRRLAGELSPGSVEFAGPIPPERMPDFYSVADIYLNSSEIDNMPTSLLEAFASGLPVVTTNAGGIPYIVEHERTGLLVECGQPAQMAAAVLRLLEEQTFAQQLIERAREECGKYRWDVLRAQWLDLYREMVSRQKGAPLPGKTVV